ncbi:MAG: BTAD domain-containing putative transcriptional regulator [Ilumatobacteraceae bacterium]
MAGGGATSSSDRTGKVCVLGSISIDASGKPVSIGGEKPRRLLAALILHRNSVVSTDLLMNITWGDDIPDSGLATLQSYVSRLRRALPPPIRLDSQQPGYRLVVEPGVADVDRFETAFAAGLERQGTAGTKTLAHLDEALAEWRGDAFAEFSDEWWAEAEATRLSELRLQAREARLATLLALGLDEAAASDASALTVDHPWRERPWVALLLALNRMGRQGEALRAANDYRVRLRDDLGLEPSPEFVRVERDVAAGAIDAADVPGEVDQPTTWPRPMQQPRADIRGLHLIGRDDDVARVVELCSRQRLVTLLGPGGIGKTQIALRAAAQLTADGSLGNEMVELAPVRDEHSVVAAIATHLQVQPQQGRSVMESVLDLLGTRPLLLVLDNCEHVLDTVARFIERLLRVCPNVYVLGTSREPLALPVETVYKVPTLTVANEGSDFAAHVASPAVALFMQRACAANPDFVADEASAPAIAELCRRLDGIPLAIELAAARTRSLSPTEIIERLGDRFTLLTGSSRVSDERHRSLKYLVDWSYDLLDSPSQQLFRRLSIFAGSFDLDSVEQVCGYGEIPRDSVASLLASLVDKSMVQASAGPRTTYRLLETLREYGASLDESEAQQLARRHGAWILDISERCANGLHGADEREWLDRFDGLFDDVRLAVRNSLHVNDLSTALGIVVSAREHAFRRLRYELIGWVESVLAHPDSSAQPLAAAGWGIVAYGRFVRGEIDAAIEIGERSAALARLNGTDTLGLAERALGNAYVFRGDNPRSTAALDRLIDGAVASGDLARIAHANYMRSLAETRTAGTQAGMVYAQRAAEAALPSRNPTAQAQAAYALGVWLATTDPANAREHLDRSEALASEVGNLWFELFARTETLWLEAHDAEPVAALRAFADVISAWHRAGDWANQWLSLRHVLGICHMLGADELAAVIHGALERADALDAFPFQPSAAAKLTNTVTELRQRLGEHRFAVAHQQAQRASTSSVIDLIVSQLLALR